jgi:uncharacterized protein YbjT (DUF2867 family)
MNSRKILVLGASGLIGRFVTDDLRLRGFQAIGVARHFSASQRSAPSISSFRHVDGRGLAGAADRERDRSRGQLPRVLQDGPGDTRAVHCDFVGRLLAAIRDSGRAVRLVHISIPGTANEDRTAFSTTKREAERLIAASGIAYAIVRPGFVVAPAAYGGSAMLRALAAFPLQLPADESATPFQPVAVEDIAETIAWLAGRDIDDAAARAVTWDLMQKQPIALGNVIDQFRWSFGTSGLPRITLPAFLLDLGARLGDLANRLGWMPPMRSTAIAELRRGVTGDPASWMAATGIVPKSLAEMVGARAATIQDKWFARLFLIKALVIASLALFWTVSGFITLFVSYRAAAGILSSHGFPASLAHPVTILTILMDMSICILIALRRTAGRLIVSILASLAIWWARRS